MSDSLVGPPCLHCGLVTFASPCGLLAYGLEEHAIEGWAVECLMCKSKGPFAYSPQEAIMRYSPWVSFEQRLPLENQNVVVWDREAKMGGAIHFSHALHQAGRYASLNWTHWSPVAPEPTVYHRITEVLPEVYAPVIPDATVARDNDFDLDDLPF